MASELILYSTEHCTLCDEAFDMLLSMPELRGYAVRVIDITSDEALLASYAERIPVLEIVGGSGRLLASLSWPFDAAEVGRSIREVE